MSLWTRITGRETNPAHDLAMIGVEKRQREARTQHDRVLAKAREKRAAAGLPPHEGLEPTS